MVSSAVARVPSPVLPPVVVGVLHGRRADVGGRARGRVLDLGGAGPPVEVYRSAQVSSVSLVEPDPDRAAAWLDRAARRDLDVRVLPSLDDVPPGESFDSVVSILGLAGVADLTAALDQVAAHLDRDGELHFVEPVSAPGAWRSVATPMTALLPSVGRLHLNRDVPSAVRSRSLTVVAIERFTMPTAIWPLRPFVQATARRIHDRSTDGEHEAASDDR